MVSGNELRRTDRAEGQVTGFEPDVSTNYIATTYSGPGSFQFDEGMIEGFDDHVPASIPVYNQVISLVAELSDWLAPKGAVIADLGSGTGGTVQAIATRHSSRDLHFHLYDSQSGMLEAARKKLEGITCGASYHLCRLEEGLTHCGANLTLVLYVLQFLDPARRVGVLREARDRSRDDGALVLAEKIRVENPRWSEMAASNLTDYKAASGISPAAISRKERALRGVLIPLTDGQQRDLLAASGWGDVEVLHRWHQWALYGAFAGNRHR